MLQQYIPNVSAVSVLYVAVSVFSFWICFIWMLHMFHTHVAKRMSQIFYLFQMYVAFKCFMLQVQTASVGVHEGEQGQDVATDMWRRRRPSPMVWGGGIGHAMLLQKRRVKALVWFWIIDET